CQAVNPPEARFCQSCGAALSRACPHCGTQVGADARFCHGCGRALAPGASATAPAPAPAEIAPAAGSAATPTSLGMEGERPVVTILFCDVQGSTAMAERLDPEVWAEIMNGAFAIMNAAVHRYEGTLARLMGDAILAFFGAPVAHEDDPRRAVLT